MKKYFFAAFSVIALTLCVSSCGNNPQTAQTVSETAVETEASESFSLTENTVVSETTAMETSESVTEEYSSAAEIRDGFNEDLDEALRDYPHLTTIVDYILTDLQDEPSFIPSSMPENMIVIRLTDFNNDGNTDAFISTASMGINYCMIDNINAPKLVYNFFAFDTADFLCDTKTGQLVIKYEQHYGLFTYATSETNFIFVGDEITEISHVHFTGTSGPEEFYIVDENGEKTVCSEEDINKSIAEIEKDLQPFDGDTKWFRITVKDSGLTIEKISDD